MLTTDDRAGKVVPYVDIAGAGFFNFLTQNSHFFELSSDEQARFKAGFPLQRTMANRLPTELAIGFPIAITSPADAG